MRLNRDNAQAVVEGLETLVEQGEEVMDAANGWLDLADETDPDSRERKSEYRDTWEGAIDDLEGSAVALVEAFGYVAVPRKAAEKAGLLQQPKRPTEDAS